MYYAQNPRGTIIATVIKALKSLTPLSVAETTKDFRGRQLRYLLKQGFEDILFLFIFMFSQRFLKESNSKLCPLNLKLLHNQ